MKRAREDVKRIQKVGDIVLQYSAHGFSPQHLSLLDAINDNARGWKSMGILWSRVPESFKDVYCRVFLTPAEDMARLYPQTYLRNLSVTDRSKRPIQIHINAANWAHLPPESEYRSLRAYRTHLVLHELGHAIGYNHAETCAPSARVGVADVMQQPSKPLRGCKPHEWIDGVTGAPAAANTLAAAKDHTSMPFLKKE